MQTEKIRFAEIPYDIQVINGIHNIGNNDLALATDKGIVIFNVEQKSFKQIDIRTVTQTSNTAYSIYKDKQGELWIFSNTPGIVRLNLNTGESNILQLLQKKL